MISIEALLNERLPGFARKPAWLRKPLLALLRTILREKQVNEFVRFCDGRSGLGFNDGIVEFFNVQYQAHGCEHIPASGPVVLIANHPLGALDGAALIQMVSRVRRDVRMVVSDVLLQFRPARDILLPVDNLSGRSNRGNVGAIDQALQRGEVVIIFPAGEVSRASRNGIRDGDWRTGFLRVAERARAPILPVHVGGRNSLGFYVWSALYKPLAMLLLAREVFGNHSIKLPIGIGPLLHWDHIEQLALQPAATAAHLRRHVYSLRHIAANREPKPLALAGRA